MEQMHDPLKKELSQFLTTLIEDTFTGTSLGIELIYPQWTKPPEFHLGHLAFPCFSLSKLLKKSPADLAKLLSEKDLKTSTNLIKSLKAHGPYLNFYLNMDQVLARYASDIVNGNYFTPQNLLASDISKTMVEYSQPNTHKEIHVGHMRNISLGNSLVRLLTYCGQEVITATFPGDLGTHVAKCLWYFKYKNKESIPNENKGTWLGQMYSKGHLLLEDQIGTADEAKNRTELSQIIKEIEEKSGYFYETWKETREWSINLMKEIYQWADIKFDHWYFESEVDEASLKLVKEYTDKGLFTKSEGAIGIDLSDYKLGFCLLLKTDGHGLYATKDLELAKRKFQDYKVQKSIYVVDQRQAHHFKQVFKVLELMGFKQAKDCHHLEYNYVELPDGPISSRKGNIVPLTLLIEKMETQIKNQYLARYQADWSQKEIDHTAKVVAEGAIKYGMLMVDPAKKIVFDMENWLKLDGESGPYLQYTHARICSLLEKLADPKQMKNWAKSQDHLQNLKEKVEEMLILHLTQFNSTIVASTLQYKPSLLTAYLYDLCKLFNSFYAECPIGKASNSVKEARLLLSYLVSKILQQGLTLLGIKAPQKM